MKIKSLRIKIFLQLVALVRLNKFVELTLKYQKPKKLVIFSRDEMKQWKWQKNLRKIKG